MLAFTFFKNQIKFVNAYVANSYKLLFPMKATINWLQTTNQIKIFIVTKSNLQNSPQDNTCHKQLGSAISG